MVEERHIVVEEKMDHQALALFLGMAVNAIAFGNRFRSVVWHVSLDKSSSVVNLFGRKAHENTENKEQANRLPIYDRCEGLEVVDASNRRWKIPLRSISLGR